MLLEKRIIEQMVKVRGKAKNLISMKGLFDFRENEKRREYEKGKEITQIAGKKKEKRTLRP